MGMDGSGLSVADALALQRDNYDDGMFGGNGSWVFFLFFLLAWGGGGFWGNNRGVEQVATNAEVQRGFDNQNVMNKLNGLENGLCDGFYAQNTTMLNGFNGVQRDLMANGYQLGNQIAENRFAAQDCCCTTNRNIDSVRAENYKNTCEIVNAINADGEKTRAVMVANTIQELRDKLADRDRDLLYANLQNSQYLQNSYLIDALRPVSRPAYITCSPYQSTQNYCCGGYGVSGCAGA